MIHAVIIEFLPQIPVLKLTDDRKVAFKILEPLLGKGSYAAVVYPLVNDEYRTVSTAAGLIGAYIVQPVNRDDKGAREKTVRYSQPIPGYAYAISYRPYYLRIDYGQ